MKGFGNRARRKNKEETFASQSQPMQWHAHMHASGRHTIKSKEAAATLHGVGTECLQPCDPLPV